MACDSGIPGQRWGHLCSLIWTFCCPLIKYWKLSKRDLLSLYYRLQHDNRTLYHMGTGKVQTRVRIYALIENHLNSNVRKYNFWHVRLMKTHIRLGTSLRSPHEEALNHSLSIIRQGQSITKTCLYNFDPLKPHFYIVKLGFTGVYIIFLISAQKHRLWVHVRTASLRRF